MVSVDSARRAARRGLKISTGFNSTQAIKSVFEAYREEAKTAGFVAGPDCLALRRRVTVAATTDEARGYASAVAQRLKAYVALDSRVHQSVPDSPPSAGGFTVSDDEFITGTPKQVASDIIEQCASWEPDISSRYELGCSGR